MVLLRPKILIRAISYSASLSARLKQTDNEIVRMFRHPLQVAADGSPLSGPQVADVFSQGARNLAYSSSRSLDKRFLRILKIFKWGSDAVSYNTVLGALSRAGLCEEAARLMKEMRSKGFKHDSITYSSILEAVGKVDEEPM